MKKIVLVGFASLAMACGSSTGGGDTSSSRDTGFSIDTAPSDDTGSTTDDTGTTKDSGKTDTGSAADTAVTDSGTVVDTGTAADSGSVDTGTVADTGTAVDTAVDDTGAAVDTAVADTGTADTGVIDTAVAADSDGGPAPENTVGNTCTTDLECDPLGTRANRCTATSPFTKGTLEPTPVCIGLSCDPGTGTTVVTCDNSRGVCLSTGTPGSGVCLPGCTFDNSTAAPVGCQGLDACNVYAFGTPAGGTLVGVGFCFGGCAADADCTGGDKCQVESGLCVKTPVTYAKAVGDACTTADTGVATGCECLASATTTNGYCSTFCRVGDTTCGAFGTYVCSAALPSTDFTSTPVGMAGNCLKTCATAADCTGGTTCKSTPEGMVCLP